MYGLAGAHRVGKSTLAQRIEEDYELPYIQLPKIMEASGIDVSKDIKTFGERLDIQEKILDAAIELYRANRTGFITDRTPLDFYAYTIAEALKENISEEEEQRLFNYKYRCIEALNTYFQHVFIIQPGIEYKTEEGKPPPNLAYQEHIAALILGTAKDDLVTSQWSVIKRHVTDLERRVELITNAIEKSEQDLANFKSSVVIH